MAERNEPKRDEREERKGEQQSSGDLKEREYRDDQGDVHHHTRTFEEQHGERGGGQRSE